MRETEQPADNNAANSRTLTRRLRDQLSKVRLWQVALALLTIGYFFALLLHAPNIYDEGLTTDGAVRILHGQLPYRDFNTGYAPAEFYMVAAVFSVFGTTLLAARIWDTLWRLAILGMAIALAKEASPGQKVHWLPLVCIAMVTGACGTRLYQMTNSAMTGFTLVSLVALWCTDRYFNRQRWSWLLWAGAATGVAILYRHDLGACLAGAIMIATWYRVIAERLGQLTRSTAIFVVGALAVLVPPFLYFWIKIPHEALVQSFIDFPRTNLAGRYIPLPGPGSILAWAALYLPLAIMLAAVLSFRQTQPARRPTLVLFLVLIALVLAQAAQRLDAPHSYPAVIFAMLLLSICLDPLPRPGRRAVQILLLSGAVLCYAVLPLFFWMFQVVGANLSGGDTASTKQQPQGQKGEYIPRAGPIRLSDDQRQAVAYVRQRSAPDESLYVGAEKQSLAWYNDALFYFLADRPSATRFDMFVPGITTSASVQAEILQSLRQDKTPYVVLFNVPESQEANLSSINNGVTTLDDGIRQEYVQVAQFGRYSIWHRKGA